VLDHAPTLPPRALTDPCCTKPSSKLSVFDRPFSAGLLSALKHHTQFMHQVLSRKDEMLCLLASASNEHVQFLTQMRPGEEENLPSLAVDLLWHSHLMLPLQCASGCVEICGHRVNHSAQFENKACMHVSCRRLHRQPTTHTRYLYPDIYIITQWHYICVSVPVIQVGPLGYFVNVPITTPIVTALKFFYIGRLLEVPTGFLVLNHFWIQVAVSLLKPPHGGFSSNSETAVITRNRFGSERL
jgi:hypothetical protein